MVDGVLDRLEASDEDGFEFLRTDSMSLELYRLEAGTDDPQEPHTDDEGYLILEGRAGHPYR